MLGATLDGRYKIVSQIAPGGVATVYVGRDLKLERAVAIKVLRPERADSSGLKRLQSEKQLQAQLEHPGIVRLFDVGMDPLPYLVMEFVDGADFGLVLPRLSLSERLRVVRQATLGLGPRSDPQRRHSCFSRTGCNE